MPPISLPLAAAPMPSRNSIRSSPFHNLEISRSRTGSNPVQLTHTSQFLDAESSFCGDNNDSVANNLTI
jgi:hypothetical protein